ncbi:replication protein A, subunit RPA32 [Patellaria atrata CBS 101060]|uniref:Replication protein A, subunit RPA32 n=1 Tax=Patellaria atrata CBS 101060 TaxID=1346257 RepID=A0A9P4SGT8_9PEZI|nr:replication protein A, subunit RPA32 [Patellaria atrata CBS 101060]
MEYSGYGGGYSTTSYGAQGGSGGGGFMNQGSQSSPSANRSHGNDTLRPVTIKQLLDAQQPHPDAEFKIDGAEITQLTFVGQIRSLSSQATHTNYTFDDGTGTIEVKKWIDADAINDMDTDDSKPKLVANTYARVWGRLKAFNNRRNVTAHVVRPITDYNEISYHLLEATVVHLHFTRGPPGTGVATTTNNGGYTEQQNNYGGQQGLLTSMSPAARKVYECIRTSEQSHTGLHCQYIASRIGMELSEVGRAGFELLEMGAIYTTVDDETWAPLDI